MAFTFFLPDGYSKADLMNLNRVHTKLGKIRRWLIPVLRVVLTLGGVLLILMAALLAFDGVEDGMLSTILVFFLVGVLWLLLGLFRYRISAWNSRRLTLKGLGSITVTLGEDGIEETSSKGHAHYTYEAFVKAACYRDTLFLFLDKNHALILPFAAMKGGTATELDNFWARHSSLPIRHIGKTTRNMRTDKERVSQ